MKLSYRNVRPKWRGDGFKCAWASYISRSPGTSRRVWLSYFFAGKGSASHTFLTILNFLLCLQIVIQRQKLELNLGTRAAWVARRSMKMGTTKLSASLPSRSFKPPLIAKLVSSFIFSRIKRGHLALLTKSYGLQNKLSEYFKRKRGSGGLIQVESVEGSFFFRTLLLTVPWRDRRAVQNEHAKGRRTYKQTQKSWFRLQNWFGNVSRTLWRKACFCKWRLRARFGQETQDQSELHCSKIWPSCHFQRFENDFENVWC